MKISTEKNTDILKNDIRIPDAIFGERWRHCACVFLGSYKNIISAHETHFLPSLVEVSFFVFFQTFKQNYEHEKEVLFFHQKSLWHVDYIRGRSRFLL